MSGTDQAAIALLPVFDYNRFDYQTKSQGSRKSLLT